MAFTSHCTVLPITNHFTFTWHDPQEIEAEMARTQKNKATNYHLGTLKAKLAKLRNDLLIEQGGGGGGGREFVVISDLEFNVCAPQCFMLDHTKLGFCAHLAHHIIPTTQQTIQTINSQRRIRRSPSRRRPRSPNRLPLRRQIHPPRLPHRHRIRSGSLRIHNPDMHPRHDAVQGIQGPSTRSTGNHRGGRPRQGSRTGSHRLRS